MSEETGLAPTAQTADRHSVHMRGHVKQTSFDFGRRIGGVELHLVSFARPDPGPIPDRTQDEPRTNPGRTGIGLACPAGKSFGSALLQTSVAPSDDFGKRARAEHHHHHHHRRRIGYRLP